MSNILKIAASGVEAAPTGYQISRSLRFNSADSAYLSRTPASAGNRKTFTWSCWVKRSAISFGSPQSIFTAAESGTSNPRTDFQFFTDDTLRVEFNPTGSAWVSLITTQVFRDPSSFGHLIVAVDTTQATAANRVKIYWNGVQITAFGTEQYPNQNTDLPINNAWAHSIGRYQAGTSGYFNGYLAEVHFVDGQALTPSDFGETDTTTGVWKPKAYAGTYGTNGFYLDFSDNSSTTALGYDAAGSNNWTPNNFSVTAGVGNDSLVDTPTPYGTDTGAGGEVRGNYCTLNPLKNGMSLSNGNLTATNSASTYSVALGTIGVSSGKWYWEVTATTASGASIGVGDGNTNTGSYLGLGNDFGYTAGGNIYGPNDTTTQSGLSTYTNGDVIGVALDLDSSEVKFYKNNSLAATVTGLSSTTWFPAVSDSTSGSNPTFNANFGQRPFAYTAPSGFKALCTQNLPTPTVVQGDDYFNTVLWNGNNETAQSITGVGFQPDFVWSKVRNTADLAHRLIDAVRGPSKQLYSDLTNAEGTDSQGMTSFDSDGFSVGTSTSLNYQTRPFVGWCWNAGGSNATNTDGTITSTVRANPTAGFSIVSWTAPSTNQSYSVGHGLGIKPAMVISKSRSYASGSSWWTWHTSLGDNTSDYVALNSTNGEGSITNMWGTVGRTDSVIGFNAPASTVTSETYIAYCFAEVEGFSKFGSYTGNGSTNGPFIYTGFRPAFVMIKAVTGVLSGYDTWRSWYIVNNAMYPYNSSDENQLWANLSVAEDLRGDGSTAGNLGIDLLSNGFKIQRSSSYAVEINYSGATMIYVAFAENPFKYSLAR